MLFGVLKWYLIIMSVYFVIFYFYYMLTASKRDKVFPSLLEVINHIRETKKEPCGFMDGLKFASGVYAIFSALYLFGAFLTGNL